MLHFNDVRSPVGRRHTPRTGNVTLIVQRRQEARAAAEFVVGNRHAVHFPWVWLSRNPPYPHIIRCDIVFRANGAMRASGDGSRRHSVSSVATVTTTNTRIWLCVRRVILVSHRRYMTCSTLLIDRIGGWQTPINRRRIVGYRTRNGYFSSVAHCPTRWRRLVMSRLGDSNRWSDWRWAIRLCRSVLGLHR